MVVAVLFNLMVAADMVEGSAIVEVIVTINDKKRAEVFFENFL